MTMPCRGGWRSQLSFYGDHQKKQYNKNNEDGCTMDVSTLSNVEQGMELEQSGVEAE